MANHHATHFAKIKGVKIVACVDVSPERVAAFAKQHKILNTFTSLEAAIAWGEFDSCTNVTPDKAHYPTTMALIKAGKNVLCEKPLATDYKAALEMTEAAEAAGLVNMVNLTYRKMRGDVCWRAKLARCGTWRRLTCKAGWFPRLGGIGAQSPNGCGACQKSTGRTGFWVILAFISSILPLTVRARTLTTCLRASKLLISRKAKPLANMTSTPTRALP